MRTLLSLGKAAALVVAMTASATAQRPEHWLTLGGGPVLRDTRDYDVAKPHGTAGWASFEWRVSPKSGLEVGVMTARFKDQLIIVPALTLNATRDLRGVPVTQPSFNWDPNLNGHSELTVWSFDASYRRYLKEFGRGPFAGAILGLTNLEAQGQGATRVAAGVSAGYLIAIMPNVRASVEGKFEWIGLNVPPSGTAKSPRFLVPLIIGARVGY